MSFTEIVPYIDLIGYLGGGVTLWSLYQKTMIPLRVGAVVGNVGFMAFGLLVPSYPTLILHTLLLPLNTYRMIQMIRLVREIREAASQTNSLDPLIPYMKEKAGTRGNGPIPHRRRAGQDDRDQVRYRSAGGNRRALRRRGRARRDRGLHAR